MFASKGWGQQVIGSFPSMDGGFENQVAGTPVTASSIATGIQRTDWTVQNTSGTATISLTGGRSGPKFITFGATAARRLQSPTAADNAIANATSYTVQFFYRTSGTTSASSGQVGNSPDGTGQPGTYAILTLPGTDNVWTKVTQSQTSGSSAASPRYGVGIIRFSAASGVNIDIDDYVIYAGALDVTPPNVPGTVTVGNATASSLDVSWLAASGGVDGGGYVVVRYSINPNADNDPNQNGIYAVGNTITNGTGSLVGTVRYLGTGLSFTDNVGLNASTAYWYKVYTVDKAFNYSVESVGSGTTTAATPTLSVTPTSLSGFTYVQGSGPSTAQSFSVSGSNLNGTDVTITAPTNFEVSTAQAGTYGNTVTLTTFGGAATTIWVRLAAGLSVNSYSGNVAVAGGGATTQNVAVSGSVTAPIVEPTNHATNFTVTATSATTVTVSWTDASPAAAGYLIIGAAGDCSGITNPVDGVAQSNAALIHNVAAGVQSHTFSSLTPVTGYCFRIFPYNGTGSSINYKIDGEVPQASATTSAPIVYSWIGDDNASWAVSANWNPARTTPDHGDILQFNGGEARTVTAVPAQTIRQLLVSNNTAITLQAAATNTLTIAGGTDTDLVVGAGSQLNISGANALSISLSTDATGSISGQMTLAGAAHRLLAVTASGITFNSGAFFTAGTGFDGNAFGGTGAIANSIVFSAGSTYVHIAGSNPFGLGQPASVVIFQTGSNYIHRTTGAPSFGGRTYANFEHDHSGAISPAATAAVSMDNLRVTQGTLNFNVTDTPGHSIKGNIEVMSGATLNFNPATAGTVNLNGTSVQTISGGGTITAGSLSTLVLNNAAGVVLNTNASLHNLTVSGGGFTIRSTADGTGSLITSGTVTGNVRVERHLPNADHWYYISSPVDLSASNFGAIFPGGTGNPVPNDFYRWAENFEQTGVTGWWFNIQHQGNEWTTTSFAPGRGYAISYATSPTTITLTGAPYNANQTIAMTRTVGSRGEGWNLVGNPFPATIAANDPAQATNNLIAINSAVLDASFTGVYLWDDNTNDYLALTHASPATRLQPGQAFMVRSAANNNNFALNTAKRIHGAATFYKGRF